MDHWRLASADLDLAGNLPHAPMPARQREAATPFLLRATDIRRANHVVDERLRMHQPPVGVADAILELGAPSRPDGIPLSVRLSTFRPENPQASTDTYICFGIGVLTPRSRPWRVPPPIRQVPPTTRTAPATRSRPVDARSEDADYDQWRDSNCYKYRMITSAIMLETRLAPIGSGSDRNCSRRTEKGTWTNELHPTARS